MKKIITLFITALFLHSFAAAEVTVTTDNGDIVILHPNGTWSKKDIPTKARAAQPHFVKSFWGNSKKIVKASSTEKPAIDEDHALLYNSNVAGLEAATLYLFTNNKLVRGKYVINERHSNASDFLSDFSNLEKLLTKKYGKPDSADTYWKNDLYKSDPSEWGMALKAGHLAKYTIWKTPVTSIILYIGGDNYKVDFGIEYASVKLKELESKSKEKANLKDL